MKTKCRCGVRAEEGVQRMLGEWRNALSWALKGSVWKAGEGSQGLCCYFGAVNLRAVCVHFSDSPRGLLGFGCA